MIPKCFWITAVILMVRIAQIASDEIQSDESLGQNPPIIEPVNYRYLEENFAQVPPLADPANYGYPEQGLRQNPQLGQPLNYGYLDQGLGQNPQLAQPVNYGYPEQGLGQNPQIEEPLNYGYPEQRPDSQNFMGPPPSLHDPRVELEYHPNPQQHLSLQQTPNQIPNEPLHYPGPEVIDDPYSDYETLPGAVSDPENFQDDPQYNNYYENPDYSDTELVSDAALEGRRTSDLRRPKYGKPGSCPRTECDGSLPSRPQQVCQFN